ncbi:hypothetical protein P9112_012997 [Eukaryota sp. TZLM1-RC]
MAGTASPTLPPLKQCRVEGSEEHFIVRPDGRTNSKGHRVSFAPSPVLVEKHQYTPDPNEWVVFPAAPIPSLEEDVQEKEEAVSQPTILVDDARAGSANIPVHKFVYHLPPKISHPHIPIKRPSDHGLFGIVARHVSNATEVRYSKDTPECPPDNPKDLTDTLSALLTTLQSTKSVPDVQPRRPVPTTIPMGQQPVNTQPIFRGPSNTIRQVPPKPTMAPVSSARNVNYGAENPYPQNLFPSSLPYDVRGPEFVMKRFADVKKDTLDPCHFFSSKKGCNRGQGCDFLHDPSFQPYSSDKKRRKRP